jgi:hypothetical protein
MRAMPPAGRHTSPAPPVETLNLRRPSLPAPGPVEDDPVDRSTARRLVAGGLVIGVLAELLLDGPAFGINVPIVVAATLAVAWLIRRPGRAPDPLDVWLPVTALVLAAFVALRGDPFVAFLDTGAALAFLGASVIAMSGLAVTRRSAVVVATMGAWTLEGLLAGASRVAIAARFDRLVPGSHVPGRIGPFVRGLVLGLPLAMIFAVLFASADPIFRQGLADLLDVRLDLGSFAGRLVFALGCAWLATGLLTIAALGIPSVEASSLGAAAHTRVVAPAGRLGTAEALVVLVSIDSVFGAFVALQVAYLFGGLDTLVAAGLTYSDYARRGFFELVAAACLAGGLIVALETTVASRTRSYVVALLALIGLTAVVLTSAAVRLRLYQDAYGWTELRLYVFAAIGALAASLGTMAWLSIRGRMRWLGHWLGVIAVVTLVGLNLVAPAAYVADRNVERVVDPSLVPPDGHAGLDAQYLQVLPDDAIPVLVAALPSLPPPERAAVTSLLRARRSELVADPALSAPAAWNLGRERARAALATLP